MDNLETLNFILIIGLWIAFAIDCLIRIMMNRINKRYLKEMQPTLDDASKAANVLIKMGYEKSGQEMHENIGFIKSKFQNHD